MHKYCIPTRQLAPRGAPATSMSPNNVLPLEKQDESYSLMGIDPDVQPLFDLCGFVCGCPEFWSSLSTTESGQSVPDPAQQLAHLLHAHYSHIADLSNTPTTQWTPVPVSAGLPQAYSVRELRHPIVKPTVRQKPRAGPSHVFKETCIFWYHGRCKNGDACEREHALNYNWPVRAPPGYSHNSRQCKLLFCPFRSDLAEFMQKYYPNSRVELKEEEATDTEEDDEVTDDDSMSDLLTSPSESHDGETSDYDEAAIDHNSNYVNFHRTTRDIPGIKSEPESASSATSHTTSAFTPLGTPEFAGPERQGLTLIAHTRDEGQDAPSHPQFNQQAHSSQATQKPTKQDRKAIAGANKEKSPSTLLAARHGTQRTSRETSSSPELERKPMTEYQVLYRLNLVALDGEIARELGYHDIEDVQGIFERGTYEERSEIWDLYSRIRLRRGPPPAASADLLYRDDAIPFNRKKQKSKNKREKQESGPKGSKRQRLQSLSQSGQLTHRSHQLPARPTMPAEPEKGEDTEGSASMDESE
ncbi:hypothetical protein GRF29_19g3025424 [Pseudopithomyces chartarum]|uniref:C3H1-type domain-containing protein n=1 Tax=Pseudopithomyces chartarum TaxID=1892770 RepID=A0AAN6M682_9PLEO|nr:hypothetical protein GRF29_19g3025424 [Pseudopithomyces chartarum]